MGDKGLDGSLLSKIDHIFREVTAATKGNVLVRHIQDV